MPNVYYHPRHELITEEIAAAAPRDFLEEQEIRVRPNLPIEPPLEEIPTLGLWYRNWRQDQI